MRNLIQNILKRLGVESRAYTPGERIWNSTSKASPKAWFDKIKLPNYPVSEILLKRFSIKFGMEHTNRRANKYIEYQTRRLFRHINNPRLFWVIGYSLMYRSTAFRVAFINKCLRGWYQNRTLESILSLFFRIPTLKGKWNVKTTRFYIPKSNGKLRPVGSPRKDWLVHQSMFAWLLGIFVEEKLSSSQHAFRPQRGIWTAWLDILENALPSLNIYEFDLTKFFNSIRLYKEEAMDGLFGSMGRFNFNKKLSLQDCLIDLKVPQKVSDLILRMQTNDPTILDTDVVDKLDPELWHKLNSSSEIQKLVYRNSMDSPLKDTRPLHNQEYGLTQGSPLSPILAIIAIDKWKAVIPTVGARVLYADDGIFYNNSYDLAIPAPETRTIMQDLGVTINEKKSGMIKLKGKWLKSLRFLGSEYDPFKDTLNGVPVKSINPDNFFKIVGKTYNVRTPEEWDWAYVKGSMLWKLNRMPTLWEKLLIWVHPMSIISGYNKWDYNLPIAESSTICTAHLLYGLKHRRLFRKLKI